MSEEKNQKQDKRRLVSSQRLLNLQKMREAKAAKAAERKNIEKKEDPQPELQPKIELQPVQHIEEDEENKEVSVPMKKAKSKPNYSNYSLQDEIQKYIEAALPPEFSRENRKKQKWEMRKTQIKEEILQSLQPSTPTPQPSEALQKNVAKNSLQMEDLFYKPNE